MIIIIFFRADGLERNNNNSNNSNKNLNNHIFHQTYFHVYNEITDLKSYTLLLSKNILYIWFLLGKYHNNCDFIESYNAIFVPSFPKTSLVQTKMAAQDHVAYLNSNVSAKNIL